MSTNMLLLHPNIVASYHGDNRGHLLYHLHNNWQMMGPKSHDLFPVVPCKCFFDMTVTYQIGDNEYFWVFVGCGCVGLSGTYSMSEGSVGWGLGCWQAILSTLTFWRYFVITLTFYYYHIMPLQVFVFTFETCPNLSWWIFCTRYDFDLSLIW